MISVYYTNCILLHLYGWIWYWNHPNIWMVSGDKTAIYAEYISHIIRFSMKSKHRQMCIEIFIIMCAYEIRSILILNEAFWILQIYVNWKNNNVYDKTSYDMHYYAILLCWTLMIWVMMMTKKRCCMTLDPTIYQSVSRLPKHFENNQQEYYY